MNKQLLMKGSAFPVVLFCTTLLLAPQGEANMAKANTVVAQQVGTIKGTIVDSNGEPVIGASVLVVGQKGQGTVTDFDGNFSLNVKPGTKLKISYIGCETQTVTAKNGMHITMKDDKATSLNAVEVVAYGVQKKVSVTGALSSIKSEDLTRTPVGDVSNVLGGALSGVTTVQYSGEPGNDDNTSVFVRGRATFDDNGAKPLIQVDGVERSMNDVDPEEIESITVLKDASATAVFGVQGANGVILITTKRGQEGKAKITGSTSWGILTPTKMVEQADSYQYASFHNLIHQLDNTETLFTPAVVQKFKDGSDPIRFPSTQWAKYIMKDATLQTKHNLNISGGNKFAKYFFNIGYYTQGGLFEQFGQPYDFDFRYKRFNYRANLDLNVTKTTSISVNIAGNVGMTYHPYNGQTDATSVINAAYVATPFSSPGIIDGRYISTSTQYEDCGLDQLPFLGSSGIAYFGNASSPGGFKQRTVNKLQFDLSLKQKLDFVTKGLSFRIKGSYNGSYTYEKTGSAKKATYEPVLQEDGTYLYKKSGNEEPLTYGHSTGRGRNWYFETGLNYNRKFGLHSIGGLVLYNQKSEYYPSSYTNIPHRRVGLVGRVTYDWNNRYMAEFNVGYNGSENFANGRRYGLFPAVSGGWVVSDEPFFKPLNKVVSFMKLRASYGLVGNDNVGARFLYTPDTYAVNQGSVAANKYHNGHGYIFGVDNGTPWLGAYESALHNAEVTWEHAYKQDYGIDIKFFKDRLSATFDYYYEHRTDILLTDYTAPTMIGFTMPKVNQGVVNSWGWELSMKWQDKIGKNFRYWAGFNLSHNDNEIIEQLETPQPYDYMMNKGHRLKSRSLYKFWRFYDEDTPALYEKTFGQPFPKQLNKKTGLRPGDAVYVDLNGDGVIDGNDVSKEVGKYTDEPRYMIGINMGFRWKDLSLNMQWTGAWQVSRMLEGIFRTPFSGTKNAEQGGLLTYVIDHSWTPDNPSQDAEYPRPTFENADNNYASSTLFEKDSKYLRLKTLQVAYDFHFPLMKKMGMNQLQLALSGYNLLTFTPYIWGDPEARATALPSYPLQRTYTLTLKVGF